MHLIDILKPECVLVPLRASDKWQAIDQLIDLLCDQHNIAARAELKQAVRVREQTRTTGIGHGVAIPHGKIAGCSRLVMAVARADPPLDFAAIDGKPVDLVFLLASPLDQTGPHIQALAAISRMLTSPDFRDALKSAVSADLLYQAIAAHEAQQPAAK